MLNDERFMTLGAVDGTIQIFQTPPQTGTFEVASDSVIRWQPPDLDLAPDLDMDDQVNTTHRPPPTAWRWRDLPDTPPLAYGQVERTRQAKRGSVMGNLSNFAKGLW